jgi:endo-1,4-beta-xylanase
MLARSFPLLVVLALLIAGGSTPDEAHAKRAPISGDRATLATPADTLSLQARLRRCQRGRTLTLRIGRRTLRTRLPRQSTSIRRRWRVRLAAGPVRWRARIAGSRRGCSTRLAAGSLVFASGRSHTPSVAQPPVPPRVVDAAAPVAGPGIAFGTAIDTVALQGDAAYAATSARFDSWTPENAMKMEQLVPATSLLGAPEYRFSIADAFVDRARREGRQVHGHTLVFKHQIPQWVRDRQWTEDELRSFLREYVTTVMGRYRGRIASWDVVNEPLDHAGRFDGSTFWARKLGESYIADAFHAARAADPDATLYLNEVLDVANPVSEGVYALVQRLKAEGVPIDGIGLQTHVQARQRVLTEQAFYDIYSRFAALGVKVAVSEMDVETAGPGEAELQTQVYGNAARACARVPACERFTVWGVTDSHSWLGADKAALPIDGAHRLKPAWTTITDALAGRPAAGR